jgi:hypothetical protein
VKFEAKSKSVQEFIAMIEFLNEEAPAWLTTPFLVFLTIVDESKRNPPVTEKIPCPVLLAIVEVLKSATILGECKNTPPPSNEPVFCEIVES